MMFQNQRKAVFNTLLILVMIAGFYGMPPVQVSAEQSIESSSQEQVCEAGSGWMWTNGPSEPGVAVQVQQELSQQGIKATVEAKNYGETDSCGTYHSHGIDFTIRLKDASSKHPKVADEVLATLNKFGQPHLGNVKLFSAQGEQISLNQNIELTTTTTQSMAAEALATDVITKKVYVIVYDPLLSNGQKLSQYKGWNNHATITQQTLDLFSQASNGHLNYTVVDTTIVTSGWPELIDGFTYTEQEYLAVLANESLHHQPSDVNYNKIVNSPEFDICGKVNRGEIDEVWIYNAPWFGFAESTLVGPGAYLYNSGPVPGPHNCNRLIPIMGPSVERNTTEATHNFIHRTEATMAKVYGGWAEDRTDHNWDRFGLVKLQSPNYSYSGCGSAHWPPNAVSAEYDYSNLSATLSNCGDFLNYPNLGDPLQVAQPITCSDWGCTGLGYNEYWFHHLPSFSGCGSDNIANDWWIYFADPASALSPSSFCSSNVHWISGNATVAGVTLSYTDGVPKTIMTDSFGDYSLVVSNNWSGTITPSKLGKTFSPVSRSYTDVTVNYIDQDYSTQIGGPNIYYVNIATGNNGNSCTSVASPCRNIQETINKANSGAIIYVTSGRYLFSTNGTPNVVIVNKNIKLSGGWNADFTTQNGVSTIDGANVNNGILANSGNVIVENFVVEKSTSNNGGAIYVYNANLKLKKTTLRNNTANGNGAGIFVHDGNLTLINSTISGNTAGGSGGGIYASLNSSTSVTIQNSTIAYNHASTGGGISRTNGTYNLTNTIIANNTGSTSGPDCIGTIATANFNIIENLAGCSVTTGGNNLNVDPQLDSNLTENQLVHKLLSNSPAINGGTASSCPITDQLGNTRPQGSSCDIGSVEYLLGTITPTFTSTNTPTNTPSLTPTNTPTSTRTNTPTKTRPTNTPTRTPSPTVTFIPTVTQTSTSTNTATVGPSLTPTHTATNTPTVIPTITVTVTFTPTVTKTLTPTATWTPTATSTRTNTPTITSTSASGFPSTTVIDTFNRIDGAPGKNWGGATAGYAIVSNHLDVGTGDALFWRVLPFGTTQEAYVTLTNIDTAGSELNLLLKSQSSTTWSSGVIKVLYNPVAQTVQVWTYSSVQGWVQRGSDLAVTFANGDQFGARAKSNGMIEIYRNGVLIGACDASGWTYSANGGYIGLWFINSGNALLDDFGGGTIAP